MASGGALGFQRARDLFLTGLDLGATPPGIRKAGFREVVEILRRPGQVGRPPDVATEAQLGFSAMAYQLAEALFGAAAGAGALWRELRDRARGRAREDGRETWRSAQKWVTTPAALALPISPRPRVIRWGNIPRAKRSESDIGNTMAPRLFDFPQALFSPRTLTTCLPRGIGLLITWRCRPRPYSAAISVPRMRAIP